MTKKIALIGNMNNNFFAITRHLRDLGYDAHLFFRPVLGSEHFHPKSDTFKLEYKEFCHEVNWLDRGFERMQDDVIKNQIKGFDFYIGQGDEAAAAYKCGFNMDVYYPYGSDIYKYAYQPQKYSLKTKIIYPLRRGKYNVSREQLKQGPIAKYLRGVIVNADNILAEYTNEDYDKKIKGLNFKGTYNYVPMPFIYLNEYESIKDWTNADVHWKSIVNKIRQENDFLILYHGRQEWKTYHNEFTQKNTHYLIIGFANFIKKNPSVRAGLIMLEYGTDVAHSKKLIEQLGITKWVHWMPKMYRKDLMFLINSVDICCGQFDRSYLTFGAIVESMQMKKPIIHYRTDSLYADKYPCLYPMFNAHNAEQIENAIAKATSDPELLKKMGEDACQWIKTFFVQKPIEFLQSLIENKFQKQLP